MSRSDLMQNLEAHPTIETKRAYAAGVTQSQLRQAMALLKFGLTDDAVLAIETALEATNRAWGE